MGTNTSIRTATTAGMITATVRILTIIMGTVTLTLR